MNEFCEDTHPKSISKVGCPNPPVSQSSPVSPTSDPRQITGNVSIAEMPLALYNDQLRNT